MRSCGLATEQEDVLLEIVKQSRFNEVETDTDGRTDGIGWMCQQPEATRSRRERGFSFTSRHGASKIILWFIFMGSSCARKYAENMIFTVACPVVLQSVDSAQFRALCRGVYRSISEYE